MRPLYDHRPYKKQRDKMRTTLDLPKELIEEAMAVTRIRTKTALIKMALQDLIQREKIQGLKDYFGKVNIKIDLDRLRDR